MPPLALLLVTLGAAGCAPLFWPTGTVGTAPGTDADGDGFPIEEDCDDTNPLVNPAAEEICDGADNDCDGDLLADEADEDQDGVPVCLDDCDDTQPEAAPGLPEICDGIDNDCNGETDEPGPGLFGPAGAMLHLEPAAGGPGIVLRPGWPLSSPLPRALAVACGPSEDQGAWAGLAVADANDDGAPDWYALCSSEEGAALVWFDPVCTDGNLEATSEFVWSGTAASFGGLLDFDDDGDHDVILLNGQGTVLLLRHQGVFQGAPELDALTTGIPLEAANRDHWQMVQPPIDFDGDGREDLLACGTDEDGSEARCSLLRSNGASFFPAEELTLPIPTAAVTWLDVNDDGAPDLVYGLSPFAADGEIRVSLQTAEGGLEPDTLFADLSSQGSGEGSLRSLGADGPVVVLHETSDARLEYGLLPLEGAAAGPIETLGSGVRSTHDEGDPALEVFAAPWLDEVP